MQKLSWELRFACKMPKHEKTDRRRRRQAKREEKTEDKRVRAPRRSTELTLATHDELPRSRELLLSFLGAKIDSGKAQNSFAPIELLGSFSGAKMELGESENSFAKGLKSAESDLKLRIIGVHETP